MRPLSLALGWIALAALGSEAAPQFIPPEVAEQICREEENRMLATPMPRISAPIFSGTGCPSSESRISYNYVGNWKCHREVDVQFLIRGLRLRAEKGQVVKADCAITFLVDGISEGWQLATGDGTLAAYVEWSRGTTVRFIGTASWQGGVTTKGVVPFGQDASDYRGASMKPLEALVPYRGPLNDFSPCSKKNGVIGNLTLTTRMEVDASKSTGSALLSSGSWRDRGTSQDVDDAVTLSLKWFIGRC